MKVGESYVLVHENDGEIAAEEAGDHTFVVFEARFQHVKGLRLRCSNTLCTMAQQYPWVQRWHTPVMSHGRPLIPVTYELVELSIHTNFVS